MRTQTHEVTAEGLRYINDTNGFFQEQDEAAPGAIIDLQDEYYRNQKDLLKELHIKDRTDALRDPKAYFELIAWEILERCYDRVVWSEARPSVTGSGHVETAHCAVFSPQQNRFPIFAARISFHTQLAENGGIQTDKEGKPCMHPVGYVIESGMRQSAMKPHAIYRFSHTVGGEIEVEETEFMGPVVRHDTIDPETGSPDELKVASWMNHLSLDALRAIRSLEQQTDDERSTSDRLAYLATHTLVHGNHFGV